MLFSLLVDVLDQVQLEGCSLLTYQSGAVEQVFVLFDKSASIRADGAVTLQVIHSLQDPPDAHCHVRSGRGEP